MTSGIPLEIARPALRAVARTEGRPPYSKPSIGVPRGEIGKRSVRRQHIRAQSQGCEIAGVVGAGQHSRPVAAGGQRGIPEQVGKQTSASRFVSRLLVDQILAEDPAARTVGHLQERAPAQSAFPSGLGQDTEIAGDGFAEQRPGHKMVAPPPAEVPALSIDAAQQGMVKMARICHGRAAPLVYAKRARQPSRSATDWTIRRTGPRARPPPMPPSKIRTATRFGPAFTKPGGTVYRRRL